LSHATRPTSTRLADVSRHPSPRLRPDWAGAMQIKLTLKAPPKGRLCSKVASRRTRLCWPSSQFAVARSLAGPPPHPPKPRHNGGCSRWRRVTMAGWKAQSRPAGGGVRPGGATLLSHHQPRRRRPWKIHSPATGRPRVEHPSRTGPPRLPPTAKTAPRQGRSAADKRHHHSGGRPPWWWWRASPLLRGDATQSDAGQLIARAP
jgi:hypothetical protein